MSPDTRERRNVIHARTMLRNQILKLLEGTGIKLASFISNVFVSRRLACVT